LQTLKTSLKRGVTKALGDVTEVDEKV